VFDDKSNLITPNFTSKALFNSTNGFTARFYNNSKLGYSDETKLKCLSGPEFQKFFATDLTSNTSSIGFTVIYNGLSDNYTCVNSSNASQIFFNSPSIFFKFTTNTDTSSSVWIWIGVGAAVVIVIAVLVVCLRKKEDTHDDEDYQEADCMCPKDEHGNTIHNH